jgi:hypothetical protein
MIGNKAKIAKAKRLALWRKHQRESRKMRGGGSRRITVNCDAEGVWDAVATGKEPTKPSLSQASSGNVKFLRPGQVFRLPRPTGVVDDGAFVVGCGVTCNVDVFVEEFSVKEFCTKVEGQVMWGPSFAWDISFFRQKAWAITEKLYDPVKMRSTTFEEFMLATFPQTLEMLGAEEEKTWPKVELTNEDDEHYW